MKTFPTVLHDIPGGKELFDWFGREPRFHDAELLEISLSTARSGLLRIHTWSMTDEIDTRGYYILDKHVVVTFTLDEVSAVDCSDFNMVPGIILDLEITKRDQHFCIEWSPSYGVAGSITARKVRISLAAAA